MAEKPLSPFALAMVQRAAARHSSTTTTTTTTATTTTNTQRIVVEQPDSSKKRPNSAVSIVTQTQRAFHRICSADRARASTTEHDNSDEEYDQDDEQGVYEPATVVHTARVSSHVSANIDSSSRSTLTFAQPLGGSTDVSIDFNEHHHEQVVMEPLPAGSPRKRSKNVIDGTDAAVASVLSTRCCSHDCTRVLSRAVVERLRTHYAALESEKQRRDFLWNCITRGAPKRSVEIGVKEMWLSRVWVPGDSRSILDLCAVSFAKAVGAGIRRVRELIAFHQRHEEAPAPPAPLQPLRVDSAARSHMRSFVETYVSLLSDSSPTDQKRFMPSTFSRKDLYEDYLHDPDTQRLKTLGTDPLSYATLCLILSTEFANVVQPRKTPLGKCDTCFALQTELTRRRAQLTDVDRRALQQQLKAHLRLVSAEREEYQRTRRDTASRCALSIIMDGAKKQQFPLVYPPPKWCNESNLQLPVYGIICHTFDLHRIFFSPEYLTHDVNYVLTVLSVSLARLITAHGVNFPRRTLYLQADNTTRENKNRYMMAFAGMLVHYNIFEKVQIGMLPVGHTHEDIDGMFGAWCNTRKSAFSKCYTLPDVMDACGPTTSLASHSKIFKPETIQWIANVFDWKTLFEHCVHRLQHITQHHVFVIGRAANGTIQLVSREWHSSGTWHGSLERSTGVPLFASPLINLSLPRVIPAPAVQEPQLLERVSSLLPHLATNAQRVWFQQFTKPIEPNVHLNDIRVLFTSMLPFQEELMPPPPPAIQPAEAAQDIRALPPPANPLLYKQRAVQLHDNVILARRAPANEAFVVAKVIRLLNSGRALRVQVYARDAQTGKYSLPSGKTRGTSELISVKAVLLSGFQLTAAGKMYEAIRKLAEAEVSAWTQAGGEQHESVEDEAGNPQ